MTTLRGVLVAQTATWRIPRYAGDMLWVQHSEQAAPVASDRGAYALDVPGSVPAADVQLVWGTTGGPPLAIWHQPADDESVSVGWQGDVTIGGFVERLHVLEAHDLELVIAEVEGGLLPQSAGSLPTLAQMQRVPFHRTDETDQPTTPDYTYPLLALADSVFAEYLHHALVSELAIECVARLGPDEGRWHAIVGLPLLVERVTLLAPGRFRAR